MKDLSTANFDTMTAAEFEEYLPELFAMDGKLSENPRIAAFFKANPYCAALVSDLETIADQARSLFEPMGDGDGLEPSDAVWSNIASKLKQPHTDDES